MARVLFLSAIALLLIAVAAACNGGQGDSQPNAILQSAAAKNITGPTATPTRVIPKDGKLALKQLAADITSATYKVVYDISGNDHEGALAGTFTLAADDDRQLLGFEGKVGVLEGHFVVIEDADASYLCIDGQGQKACLKSKPGAASPVPLPTAFSVDTLLDELSKAPGLTVTAAGKEKVAGEDAHCWDVASEGGKGHLCVGDDDGVLLSLDGEFEGAKLSLKAREVGEPGPGEFEPPYPIVDLGG